MNVMFQLQSPLVDSHYQILFLNVGNEILTVVWVIPSPCSSISFSSYLARHRGIFSKRTMGDYTRKLSLSSQWYLSTTNNDDRTLYRSNNCVWIFLLFTAVWSILRTIRARFLFRIFAEVLQKKEYRGDRGKSRGRERGDKLPCVSFLFEIRREICPLLSAPVLINRQIRGALTCN